MDKFNLWLQQEMDKRGLSQSELARRGNFNPASLSRVLGGTRQLGADMAVGIARALHVRPERVMYQAGLIPNLPLEDDLIEEMDAILEGRVADEAGRLAQQSDALTAVETARKKLERATFEQRRQVLAVAGVRVEIKVEGERRTARIWSLIGPEKTVEV